MCSLEVFFQEGSALRPPSSCTLRDGDLQMLNMQIAALHSRLRQYGVQIRHQVAPLLCHWEPAHRKSGPLSPRNVELFTIFTRHLRSCVEHKRKNKEGKKRKKESTCGLEYKETLSPGSGVLIQRWLVVLLTSPAQFINGFSQWSKKLATRRLNLASLQKRRKGWINSLQMLEFPLLVFIWASTCL